MKITESQLELLRSLKCERLSSKPENFSLIDDFYSKHPTPILAV